MNHMGMKVVVIDYKGCKIRRAVHGQECSWDPMGNVSSSPPRRGREMRWEEKTG